MQLLLRRQQRITGLRRDVAFQLNARVSLSTDEHLAVQKYKLGRKLIYSSESHERTADETEFYILQGAGVRALISAFSNRLALHITVDNLIEGTHVECKSMEELLATEQAIREGCAKMQGFLDTVETFDGREIVVDYTTETVS